MKQEAQHIPMSKWGKDHWSTLLYIESICTDGKGVPSAERMRQWPGRPRRGVAAYGSSLMMPPQGEYPTRLKDGTEVREHDDFDCAADMEAEGLVEWHGTGLHPAFKLTDRGWKIAHALRRHVSESKPSVSFDPGDL